MNSIILYTTKYGCVEKAAAILKSKLGGEVRSVNLMREEAPSLEAYDTVILGGSIYFGKIQKKLTRYIEENLQALTGKRIGLFICANEPNPVLRSNELQMAFPPGLFEMAVCKDIFGDELVYEKLSFRDKWIMRLVKGTKTGHSSLSEPAIESFAHALIGSGPQ